MIKKILKLWDCFFITKIIDRLNDKEDIKIISSDPINKESFTITYKDGVFSDNIKYFTFPVKTEDNINQELLRSSFCAFVHGFTTHEHAKEYAKKNNLKVVDMEFMLRATDDMVSAILD